MITENQRRALFALREALHLCDDSLLLLGLNEDGPGMQIEVLGTGEVLADIGVYLIANDIDDILAEHPDV